MNAKKAAKLTDQVVTNSVILAYIKKRKEIDKKLLNIMGGNR